MTRIGLAAAATALILGGTAFGQPAPAFPDEPAFPACESGGCATDDSRVWADAEYLLGWVQGDPLPPLVTTSPAGTARNLAGVLGTPGVGVLFGAGPADISARQGGRVEFGYWFDPERQFGFECGMFALESDAQAFGATSNGSVILARPFLDVTAGAQASALAAFPGVSSGSVAVADSGRDFVGVNADFTANVTDTSNCRIDALIGYRGLRYDERLGFVQNTTPLSGPFAAGTTITAADTFETMNIFNGLDLGLRTEFRYEALSLDVLTRVAAGPISRTVSTLGTTQTSVPGAAPVVSSGGLLALSSNIGTVTTHTLTAAPEIDAKIGWDVTPNVRVTGGYSVLWLLSVVRPGEAVDFGINPGLIPPAAPAAGSASRPAYLGINSTVWVQAISLGLEVKY